MHSWVSNIDGFSSSEWTNAIQASISSMANHGTGGRNNGNSRCKNVVCRENNIITSLTHIREACPNTERLQNTTQPQCSFNYS